MRIKRIVFVNRAPFGNIDLNFSNKNVISLTGINGVGKTTILSYIVDAFYEISRIAFYNEFEGVKKDKYYRVMSPIYNTIMEKSSLVYILFENNGKDVHYIDLTGVSSENDFNELMISLCGKDSDNIWPIKYSEFENEIQNGMHNFKKCKIDRKESESAFLNNILTYFPSYRYEQPGYLNDVFQIKMSYKYSYDFVGYLQNPIEVVSDLPEIANWIMDVALDGYLSNNGLGNNLVSVLNIIVNTIFSNKCKQQVSIGIGRRNNGGMRLQIINTSTRKMVYPTVFNISSGESSLLCIFVELLKQADIIGKNKNEVEGIVLIDEVDKHLHIKLQKEVLPILIKLFPNIQFIFSTHSPFVNMGISEELGDTCSIIDLDNGGSECNPGENEVFRQAYEVMFRENNRYANLYAELKRQLNDMAKPVVYLEGKTDAEYFNKTLEVFGYKDIKIDFRSIGYSDKNGKEEFMGKNNMDKAINFFKANRPDFTQIFLFDCDTNKEEYKEGNIIVMCMKKYDNHSIMNKGIENALELDCMELEQFYDCYEETKDYGEKVVFNKLNKMKMCDYICKLDTDLQKKILVNLKLVIDNIINRLNENNEMK